MIRFILVRLWQALLTLFAISIIVFFLARLTGDPAMMLLPEWGTEEDYQALVERLGLDRSYPEQYFSFMASVLRGDFGLSSLSRQPIGPIFFAAMINSLKLILVSWPLAFLVSIVLGMIAATEAGTAKAKFVMGIAVFGQSAPTFFVGLVLIFIFSTQLRLLPAARMVGPASYVLPGLTLTLFAVAAQTRILRNSLLQVLGSDMIKLVRLKGASNRIVYWKHALKNSILPMLTFSSQMFAYLVIGSIVTETVFAWPGVGRLIYQGIISRDYAVIQTSVLVVCAVMLMMSVIVDIIYAYIDPRIRVY